MEIKMMPIRDIKPYEKNPRKNKKAVPEVVKSIREFGFRQPLVVDTNMVLIVGHTRLLAAKQLKMKLVPVHVASDMSETQARAYRIMDNRTGEHALWDENLLLPELAALEELDEKFDADFLGFHDHDEAEDKEKEKKEKKKKEEEFKTMFEIVIECEDEETQQAIYERLSEEGLKCRVLSM